MSLVLRKLQQLNFTSVGDPAFARAAQWAAKNVSGPDIRAAAGWGVCLGVTAFWFIEPYDFFRREFGFNFGPFKAPEEVAAE
ncbi:hypothetical protein FVE85_9180 [Porphyridium purpureum]|uniref:Uncharacterized protein n=1 Tax=Porphyridium purpureum TaxID=35688 RepID=A0A5J4YNN9_PORPP|nr:hypothetical protein FVE85_9180 [Porphyridium purpureum]|eukprot:POR7926..scf222_8